MQQQSFAGILIAQQRTAHQRKRNPANFHPQNSETTRDFATQNR